MTSSATENRVSGMCVMSLICSLVWLFGLGSILAIVYGFVGVRECRTKGRRGEVCGYIGVVLGALGILATVLLAVSP